MSLTLDPPAFRLGEPATTPRFRFSAAIPDERLDERHRPSTLSEIVGQGSAVFQLESFLDAPHSTAFLFEGESGVGKTSAARALANDLGVNLDWGFELIESARGDMEAVDRALKMLRHVAPGSGFKVVIVDEADLMTPRASHLWLSALENLPPKSVVIFTTNRPSFFPDRFLDRCERIRFESDGATLRQDAQALVDKIWKEETGMDDAPSVDDLPNLVDSRGVISFRRAVLALDPMIRAKRRGETSPVSTLPFPAPKLVNLPTPAKVATARKPDRPAKSSKPAPARAVAVHDDADLASIDSELAQIDREFEETGQRLILLDARKRELIKMRKGLKRAR